MKPLKLEMADFEERFVPGTSISEFKKSCFRRKKLLSHSGDHNHYNALFKKGDFSELLSGTMLHRPSIRLVGEGRVLPMSEISNSIPYGVFSFENVVNIKKVEHWYSRGYTINLRGAHYNHSGLARSTSILKELFGCNIRTNLYLTPKTESGLVPHYDVHDVFIIQLSGEKRWQLYENNFDKPTELFRYGRHHFDVGEPAETIDLKPGHILYLPRGVSHTATALEESLHITVGIEEPTISDLLRYLANLAEVETPLRENFDCNLALRDREYLAQTIKSLEQVLHSRLLEEPMETAIRGVREQYMDGFPERNVDFLNGL